MLEPWTGGGDCGDRHVDGEVGRERGKALADAGRHTFAAVETVPDRIAVSGDARGAADVRTDRARHGGTDTAGDRTLGDVADHHHGTDLLAQDVRGVGRAGVSAAASAKIHIATRRSAGHQIGRGERADQITQPDSQCPAPGARR